MHVRLAKRGKYPPVRSMYASSVPRANIKTSPPPHIIPRAMHLFLCTHAKPVVLVKLLSLDMWTAKIALKADIKFKIQLITSRLAQRVHKDIHSMTLTSHVSLASRVNTSNKMVLLV